MTSSSLDPWVVPGCPDPAAESRLRAELRAFLQSEALGGRFESMSSAWHLGFDPAFSRRVGERGWIGMDWPVAHGGAGGGHLDRQIVVEELLAAGAPIAAHWLASQVGLLISASGGPGVQELLPAMARGELFVSLGLQEEGLATDWAATRTSATRTGDGWILSGTKQWVSHAHRSHYALVLARTSGTPEDGAEGLSQFLVDLAEPGVQVHPVYLMDGSQQVNDLVLDNVFVPESMMLGEEGAGWSVLEDLFRRFRGGPQRFMGYFPLLVEVVRSIRSGRDDAAERALGEVLAEFSALRSLSANIAHEADRGSDVSDASDLVMSLGHRFGQTILELADLVIPAAERGSGTPLGRRLTESVLYLPVMHARNGPSEALLDSLAERIRR